MNIETSGVVIKEQNIGEADRLITVLTADHGLIRAFVRRGKSMKSNLLSGTQLLSYSDFIFYQGRNSYNVTSATSKNIFFDLRNDIESMSLAFYLAELFGEMAPEGADSEPLLRLLLNSLYLLSEHKRDLRIIKSVAELRGLADTGYMPNLVACQECGEYETPLMYFNPKDAILLCQDHGEGKGGIPLSISAVTAMRYIIYSDAKKIFDFTLTEEAMKELNKATETYALVQTGRSYSTLDFFKSLATL